MTDREKFEAWASTKRCDLAKFCRGERAGQYKNPVVENMCEAYLAGLASQQPAGDGWVDWAGGECPLTNPTAEVEYLTRLRNKYVNAVGDLRWEHASLGGDIIAYRVVKP